MSDNRPPSYFLISTKSLAWMSKWTLFKCLILSVNDLLKAFKARTVRLRLWIHLKKLHVPVRPLLYVFTFCPQDTGKSATEKANIRERFPEWKFWKGNFLKTLYSRLGTVNANIWKRKQRKRQRKRFENACVDAKLMIRFHWHENATFWSRIHVDGAVMRTYEKWYLFLYP